MECFCKTTLCKSKMISKVFQTICVIDCGKFFSQKKLTVLLRIENVGVFKRTFKWLLNYHDHNFLACLIGIECVCYTIICINWLYNCFFAYVFVCLYLNSLSSFLNQLVNNLQWDRSRFVLILISVKSRGCFDWKDRKS